MNATNNFFASIVDLSELQLVVSKAPVFPDGIGDSWERLESHLSSLKGRKFYGLTYFKDGVLTYYAALETQNEAEIARLGFPKMVVNSGKYARVKLMDWEEHKDRIPVIFEELRSRYKTDTKRPEIEFYRSHRELHLLMPLAD